LVFGEAGGRAMRYRLDALFYTFLIIFAVTAIVTLLGAVKVVSIDPENLRWLLGAFLIELAGAVVALFRSAPFFPAREVDALLTEAKEESKGTPIESGGVTPPISTPRSGEGPAADPYLQRLHDAKNLLTGLAKNWPDLAVDESWQMVEAAIEDVARKQGLPNTRGLYVLNAEFDRVFGSGTKPAWTAKLRQKFLNLWRAARKAVSIRVTSEQATEFAEEAISLAWVIQDLEQYKDWPSK
jgi:hypothetical protein